MSDPTTPEPEQPEPSPEILEEHERARERGVQEADEGKYTNEYVKQLRAESAEHRTKAREAEERVAKLRERVLRSEVHEHARGVLADPADLLAFADPADLVDHDGEPDAEKIKAKVDELVESKPHLAARRTTTDVGQGPRGKVPAPDALGAFGALLKGAAR